MTYVAELWCTECDWEKEVEGGTEDSVHVSASAAAAAHVSTSECPYGSTEYEIEEKDE